jgi:hypothetical protein
MDKDLTFLRVTRLKNFNCKTCFINHHSDHSSRLSSRYWKCSQQQVV